VEHIDIAWPAMPNGCEKIVHGIVTYQTQSAKKPTPGHTQMFTCGVEKSNGKIVLAENRVRKCTMTTTISL